MRAELAEVVAEGGPSSFGDDEAVWRRVERTIEATYELLRQADVRPASRRPAGYVPLAIANDGARQADSLLTGTHDGAPTAGRIASLTPREREVLRLLTDGRTNRQIAAALCITEKTAAGHVSSILGKFGVSSRLQAVSIAMRGTAEVAPPPSTFGSIGGRAP